MTDARERPEAVIGWREWIALPDLDIPAVKAKIDTGALTSALHADAIEPFTEGGTPKVRFVLHPVQGRTDIEVARVADIVDRRLVTDSGMHRMLRYVIRTRIALAGLLWPIDVALTNRDGMRFRMLLGRRAIRGRFLVDPGSSFLAGGDPARRRLGAPRERGDRA